MSTAFDPNFVGLQVNWQEDEEIEYFGPAVLFGTSTLTAAKCKRGQRWIHYLYSVEKRRESPTRISLTYNTNPETWPASWGWDVYKGKLVIDFEDARCQVIARIYYWYQDDDTTEEFENEKDWVYFHNRESPPKLTVERRRLQTTKFDRPEQQALRNLLLSEHGKCQITGTQCVAALEACHIVPVKNGGTEIMENALILRRDIHALFDSGLLRFRLAGDFWVTELDSSISDPAYLELRNRTLTKGSLPSHRFLEARMKLEDSV